MNNNLFYKNPYIKEFTATITKITEKTNDFHIQLNNTAFFPEGGGQPSDLGFIEDVEVTYVYEEDGKIYHVLKRLPSKLEDLECSIDWERRFDNMQQHLGQHILSAAFEKLYDAQTIGFHLGNEYVTIDIDVPLSPDDIQNAEYYANQIVFNDLAVEVLYPSENELSNMPLRKSPQVSENIRVIKIDEFDYSPCCGTHPMRTGEVGLIKITKYENYKGGMRLEFVCGNRALKDFSMKNNLISSASNILSTKNTDIIESIDRIKKDLLDIKKENKNIREKLLSYEAKDLLVTSEKYKGIRIILNIFNNRSFNEVNLLSTHLINTPNTIVIFGVKDHTKGQILLKRSESLKEINMKEILKDSISLIDGKGGGNTASAQGGGKNVDKLEEAITLSYNKIKEYIK